MTGKNNFSLPRLFIWILERMIPEGDRQDVLQAIDSAYGNLHIEKGKFTAVVWAWLQLLKSIPPFIKFHTIWSTPMLKNYLTVAFRNILRQKGYSFINIFGLAVGIASFILIGLYVQYELSFDKYHKNRDRIYRVVRESSTFTPAPLGPALIDNFPEVEAVARIMKSTNMLISSGEDHFLEKTFYWAGPEIFKIFTIPFIDGNPETALKSLNSIVLSRDTARKYFGKENPLGKTLTLNEKKDYKVTGVFYNMPANSHFVMNIIVPYTDIEEFENITSWGPNFSYTYLLLKEKTNTALLESKIQSIIAIPIMEKFGYKKPYSQAYYLQPITEIHLHSHRRQEISANNDVKTIILFSSISFLILCIACINYMNLTNARSIRRSKEIGMRKVVGAQRRQLIRQFLAESLTIAFLALVISILLVLLALTTFNNLIERPLSFNLVTNPQLFVGLILIVIFVGLFAGSYPAMIISGFRPVVALNSGSTGKSKGKTLGNILVLLQFSITIILFIFVGSMKEQLVFVKNMDVGYRKEQIITMDVLDEAVHDNIKVIKIELLQHSDIIAVSTSDRLPNDIETFMTRYLNENKPDERITIYYNTVDYDFIDLYDIKIVDGRNFSRDYISDEEGVFLVNEAAVKAADWDPAVGRSFVPWQGWTGKIVGVMKDFNLHSLHTPIDPLYICLNPDVFSKISIKISPHNIPATIDYIKAVMKKFSPHYPFEYSFFDEVFDRAYHTDQKMLSTFSSFASLAIIIACLGLLGLSTFAAEQRTKEIGVRKVLGATVPGIIGLLSKDIVKWVILANIIAWPIGYFVVRNWLQNFAYRTPVDWWLFVLAGAGATAITLLTLSWQSYKSAAANPIECLRVE